MARRPRSGRSGVQSSIELTLHAGGTKRSPIVISVGKVPTMEPGLRCRAWRLASIGAAMAGLTLATTTTATVVVSPGSAAADQVSSLKAQAAQIAQDLVLEQLQISTDQQQYGAAAARVQHDEAEIGSSETQIQADVSRVSRDQRRLGAEAVSTYIHMDPESDGSVALFEDEPNQEVTRAEYEQVASGDITLTIDVLHTDEDGLQAERVTLEQQQARDQATTDQEATLANAARQTEVQLASKQSEITGELAVAVTQQQAAQAASAAAAVRAAEAKAAAAVAASTGSGPPAVGSAAGAPGGRPHVAPLPPMRPARRVRRQLRRRVAGGHVHGRFPIQPADMERCGKSGRHAAAHQRPPERGDSGRAGRPGHCALPGRWGAAVERQVPDEQLVLRVGQVCSDNAIRIGIPEGAGSAVPSER